MPGLRRLCRGLSHRSYSSRLIIYRRFPGLSARCLAKAVLFLVSILSIRTVSAQVVGLKRLETFDPLFRQLTEDVAESRALLASREGLASVTATLVVYAYELAETDDLFSVAARCNIPYESLATLNRVASPDGFRGLESVLLPTVPGLFLPRDPASDLEELIRSARSDPAAPRIIVLGPQGECEFDFLPGAEFTPTERAFFLNIAFRFPLPSGRLTSSYGPRISPISGRVHFHNGLDLAAPQGTDVYACRDGIVSALGTDAVLGTYVIIKHENGWESVYGHLSLASVGLKKAVRSGSIIGQVGSSGLSTGPHLHFELRRDGESRDPAAYLGGGLGQ